MPRPKKNKIKSPKEEKNIVASAPKKRGRKPKNIPTEEPIIPKKRGRKPKIVDPSAPVQDGPLTKEQMEDRKEKIRASIPKIDLYRTRDIYDLVKDKEVCADYTAFSCHRPDIYLDYGCSECALAKNCVCRIKDLNRRPEDRRPKFRKFTSAKKSS
jgi:hypothetical protein